RRLHPIRFESLIAHAFWQGEGDKTSAGRTTRFSSSRRDDDDLAAIDHINAGSGIAPKGEARLPKKRAGFLIEGAEGFVSGCANEHQSSGGHDRSTIVLGSCRGNAALF